MKTRLLTISCLVLVTLGFWAFNEYVYVLWNINRIDVRIDEPLSKAKVKIEFGNSISTDHIEETIERFGNRSLATLVFEGSPKSMIGNYYGENDFLITYDEAFYLSFRHYKFNWRHQHRYHFKLEKIDDQIILSVDIVGKDDLRFKEAMKIIPAVR